MPSDTRSRIKTTAPAAQITYVRPYRTDTDQAIEKPFISRANVAPSVDTPQGSVDHAAEYEQYSVLQQHTLFWDRDRDDVISPIDTFVGFRSLGFNLFFSLFSAFAINVSLSYATVLPVSYIPDFFFRIFVANIHGAKHGSDSGVFDNEGRFIPSRFEDLFTKYGSPSSSNEPAQSLCIWEVLSLMRGQRVAGDIFGTLAATLEWVSACLLLQKSGRIAKEDLRKLFDGSIFFEVRKARMSKKGWNKGWGLGGDGFWGGKKVLPFSL